MKTLKRLNNYKVEITVLLVLVFELIFPQLTFADEAKSSVLLPNLVIKPVDLNEENQKISLISPTRDYQVAATYRVPITAYSSTVDQTDSTPCITANGFDLCAHNQEDVIAANFLPFGTRVRIPEYFGDRVFTVQDRMNARYYFRADIWMKDRKSAVAWGIIYTYIEVVE